MEKNHVFSWGSSPGMITEIQPRSEFELQSPDNAHFWTNTLGKGMNPLILPSDGLNSTATVLLQGWYAIKQRKWTKLFFSYQMI